MSGDSKFDAEDYAARLGRAATSLLLLLALTGACVLAALVVGQRWQDERCAAAAGTTSACAGWVA
jgi:hypothetical protein